MSYCLIPGSYAVGEGRVDELWVDKGEARELGLVNVGDDELVWRSELWLGAREELVEVLSRLPALKRERERDEFKMYTQCKLCDRCELNTLTICSIKHKNEKLEI